MNGSYGRVTYSDQSSVARTDMSVQQRGSRVLNSKEANKQRDLLGAGSAYVWLTLYFLEV